ncbi:MAG: DUF4430 domain-containing protein [Oscillospiraceae bacterium]|nr:DUF4430 domain-containing protein [Oscillospiraceae bacterium]
MKLQTTKRLLSVILAVIAVFSVVGMTACGQKSPDSTHVSSVAAKDEGLWANAVYTEDKSFGEGAKTVIVEVIAGDKSVTFTLKTDKENLADAMLEHSLVEGTQDQYGLYIKKVNGILADYEINKSFWSVSKNGEMLMTGASAVTISDGEKYEFTYAK